MSARRAARVLTASVLVGLIFGIVVSGDDLISAEVWIGASTVTLVALATRDLVVNASIERFTLSPAWAQARSEHTSMHAIDVQNLRSMLTSAQSNPKAFDRQLRPRLISLTEHYLPRQSNPQPTGESTTAEARLGELKWLIDPEMADRAPTSAELERFMSIVVGDHEGTTP